jgi:hypothetical protein
MFYRVSLSTDISSAFVTIIWGYIQKFKHVQKIAQSAQLNINLTLGGFNYTFSRLIVYCLYSCMTP